jgi:hypothetical protein
MSLTKAEQDKVKKFLRDNGSKAAKVDDKKWGTRKAMLDSIWEIHGLKPGAWREHGVKAE